MNYSDLYIEENFRYNRVCGDLSSSNQICTLGFVKEKNNKLIPMTLLKGNKLSNKKVYVELVLSMPKNNKRFKKVEKGNLDLIRNIKGFSNLISEDLQKSLEK